MMVLAKIRGCNAVSEAGFAFFAVKFLLVRITVP